MQIDRFGALPCGGGLLDQPAGLMRKVGQMLNVYNAFRAYEIGGTKPGEMAKWRQDNQQAWDVISEVRRLREKHG